VRQQASSGGLAACAHIGNFPIRLEDVRKCSLRLRFLRKGIDERTTNEAGEGEEETMAAD